MATPKSLMQSLNEVKSKEQDEPEDIVDESFKDCDHIKRAMGQAFAQGEDDKGRKIAKYYKKDKCGKYAEVDEDVEDDEIDEAKMTLLDMAKAHRAAAKLQKKYGNGDAAEQHLKSADLVLRGQKPLVPTPRNMHEDVVEEGNNYHRIRAASLHRSAAEQLKSTNPALARKHVQSAKNILNGGKPIVATPMAEEVGSEEKEAVRKPVDTDLDTPEDVKKVKPKEGKEIELQARQPLVREAEDFAEALAKVRNENLGESKSQATEIIQSYLDDTSKSLKDFQKAFNAYLDVPNKGATPSLDGYVRLITQAKFHGDDHKLVKALFKFTGLEEETIDEVTPVELGIGIAGGMAINHGVEAAYRKWRRKNGPKAKRLKQYDNDISRVKFKRDMSRTYQDNPTYGIGWNAARLESHQKKLDRLRRERAKVEQMRDSYDPTGLVLDEKKSDPRSDRIARLKSKIDKEYALRDREYKTADRDSKYWNNIHGPDADRVKAGFMDRIYAAAGRMDDLDARKKRLDHMNEGLAGLRRAVKKTLSGEYGKQRRRLSNRLDTMRYKMAVGAGFDRSDANRNADNARELHQRAHDAYSAGNQKEGDHLTGSAERFALKARSARKANIAKADRIRNLTMRMNRVAR